MKNAIYGAIGDAVGIEIDLERIKKERPEIAKLLRDHAEETKKAAKSGDE